MVMSCVRDTADKFVFIFIIYFEQYADPCAYFGNIIITFLFFPRCKANAMEKERIVDELSSQLDKLERIREKQAIKIADLKGEVDATSHTMQEKKALASNTVQALSSELRTTKQALDQITKRERQVRTHSIKSLDQSGYIM